MKPIIKAASACVWRDEFVLLAQRGKALGGGFWSLPGGRIEDGESPLEAASRELLEETGVSARLAQFVAEFVLESPEATYVISCWTGLYLAGAAAPASDVAAVQWVDFRKLATLRLAPNTATAIARARDVLRL